MSEWRELKIDKLPEDIFAHNKYYFSTDKEGLVRINITNQSGLNILDRLMFPGNYGTVYYSKPEPKVPTHEEIMTKWWKDDCGGWMKVVAYDQDREYRMWDDIKKSFLRTDKDAFTGRESADIPPE